MRGAALPRLEPRHEPREDPRSGEMRRRPAALPIAIDDRPGAVPVIFIHRPDARGDKQFVIAAFDIGMIMRTAGDAADDKAVGVGKECVSTCRSRWSAYH